MRTLHAVHQSQLPPASCSASCWTLPWSRSSLTAPSGLVTRVVVARSRALASASEASRRLITCHALIITSHTYLSLGLRIPALAPYLIYLSMQIYFCLLV